MTPDELAAKWERYNCEQAFCYLTGHQEAAGPLAWDDVREIIAESEGERDERSWVAVGWLKTGEAFVLEAACDYTGWDCQAGGWSNIGPSLDVALHPAALPDAIRERVGAQLRAAGVALLDTVPEGQDLAGALRGLRQHHTSWYRSDPELTVGEQVP